MVSLNGELRGDNLEGAENRGTSKGYTDHNANLHKAYAIHSILVDPSGEQEIPERAEEHNLVCQVNELRGK